MSGDVLLFFASRDGQARRIAARIGERFSENGIAVRERDAALTPPTSADLSAARLIVLVAAVRYGRHLPEALRLLDAYRATSGPPLAFASVNLTARTPGKDTAEGSAYARKTIARYRLDPSLATAFAGRLDYPRYSWRDRQIIRFIMWMTGGPTEPTAQVEYTDWAAVDAYADRLIQLELAKPSETPPPPRAGGPPE